MLFAHLVGDVLVRPNTVSRYKKTSILIQVFHCFTYAGTVSTLYFFYTDNIEFLGVKFMFLFLTHVVIDSMSAVCNPVEWFDGNKVNINKWYVLDQSLHGLVIVILAFWKVAVT